MVAPTFNQLNGTIMFYVHCRRVHKIHCSVFNEKQG